MRGNPLTAGGVARVGFLIGTLALLIGYEALADRGVVPLVGAVAIPLVALSVLSLEPHLRAYWVEVIVLSLVVFLANDTAQWWQQARAAPAAADANPAIDVRVRPATLANGATLVWPNEVLRLIYRPATSALPTATYSDLSVVGVFDANGLSVAYSGQVPDSIVLAVPPNQVAPILAALNDPAHVYLQRQPPTVGSGVSAILPGVRPMPTSSH
jgi:hypothetical protein